MTPTEWSENSRLTYRQASPANSNFCGDFAQLSWTEKYCLDFMSFYKKTIFEKAKLNSLNSYTTVSNSLRFYYCSFSG